MRLLRNTPLPRLHHLAAAAVMLCLCACVSVPAAQYQPAAQNQLRLTDAAVPAMRVGSVSAASGVANQRLSLRGNTLTGGSDGTFSTYLAQALSSELRSAGKLAPADSDAPQITAVLTENLLDASGTSEGVGRLKARFSLDDNRNPPYQREVAVEQRWPSSFMGPLAIPAAINGYTATVQALLVELFKDPAFTTESTPATAP